MANQALLLKFGVDFDEVKRSLPQLAGQVATNLAQIATSATGVSATMRREFLAASADMAGSVGKQVVTLGNLRAAAGAASEAMKVGFAFSHPGLALGLQLLGNYKYALGGVAAGAFTVFEAFKMMANEVDRVSHIIESSNKAGVSTTLFQVWTQQAEKTRLTVGQMEAALKHAASAVTPTFNDEGQLQINEFLRMADQLQNGRGLQTKSYGAFTEAGTNMDKLVQAASLVVEDFMRLGAEMDNADLKAQGIAAATKLWGDNGRALAEAVAAGKISIEDLHAKAAELGTVFSSQIVKAVDDVNQNLKQANERLSRELQPSSETLIAAWALGKGIWAGIVNHMADAAHWINSMLGATTEAQRAATAATAQATAAARSPYGGLYGPEAFPSQTVIRTPPLPPKRPSLHDLEHPADAVREPKGRAPKGGSETDEVETYTRSLEKQNATLAAEVSVIGKSNVEKEKALDLARAMEAATDRGSALTDAERSKVLALAQAHAELKQKLDDAATAKRKMQEEQGFFGDQAYNVVDGLILQHKKLKDVIGDVAKAFEQAALKALLLGQGSLSGLFGGAASGGGLGGIFGGLFGLFGAHAAGGVAGYGTPAFAPVASFRNAPHFAAGGGIPSILHAGEIVLNAAQQKNVADNMRGAPQVVVHNHAAGVRVESYVTQGQMALHVYGQINAFAQNLPGVMDRQQKRQS